MSESFTYRNTTRWIRDKKGVLVMGEDSLGVATPPEFGGHEGFVSPEDLFVASANVCFVVTFAGMCTRSGIELDDFRCEAEGILEKKDMWIFTRITLTPHIKSKAGREKIEKVLENAKKNCLVANSMKCEVVFGEIEISS